MSKHEEIAEALTQDILTGQYRVGERLPSERDLATRFEANRGAVREAMKKLEQLGIADIQPGGARVAPVNEASLDVIGHLLALGDCPDRDLVDQIMVVINTLVQTAMLSAVRRADDDGIEHLRSLVRPVWAEQLENEAYFEAQTNMFEGIMTASGNLPVQLIARSLLAQFRPQMAALKDFMDPDNSVHAELARNVDTAIGDRDLNALQASFNELSNFHRERMQRTFDAFEAARQPASMEVSAR
ncbi:MAG: FadR family transcriptional regulator [Gammaproteobacteria bacterium]|nr:MAG: FadR family transcriptional regulator [Gammaproteobacteria bacterium]